MTPINRGRIADQLSLVQMRVVLRCSDVPIWDRSGRTFSRQWPDLIGHVERASMRSLVALERRGLLYRDEVGFGLTWVGQEVQYELLRRGMRA